MSPIGAVSRSSRGSSSQSAKEGGKIMAHSIAWFWAESQRTRALPAACFGRPDSRYRGREVGGGRTTRQPGQVRKEAALTSTDRVARQPPTEFTASLSCAG